MTTKELHQILDDKRRNISLDELEDILYQLKTDCFDEHIKHLLLNEHETAAYYSGEINAFYLCLDLLEHLKGVK